MLYANGAVQWLSADGVSTTYLVSGLPFQPKALRFYWVGLQSAADAVSEAVNERRGVGFAVSTTERRSIGTFCQDTAGTSNCGAAARNDCVVCTTDGAGASDGRLDLDAILADGFRLIVDDAAPANVTIFWEAWGGPDITVAVVGDIAEPGATGDQDYTVAGFQAGAQDQVVMFAGCQSTAALNTDAATDSGLHVGFATAQAGVTVCGNSDDASTAMDTDGYCRSGECVSMIVVAGGNPDARASLTQWNEGGFRLNWAARALTNRRTVFLAIKGGSWAVGAYTIAGNSGGATATVSGLPFRPIGVSLVGRMTTEQAAGTSSANDRIGFGSGESPESRRSMGLLDEDATASSAAEVNTTLQYDQVLCYPSTAGALLSAYDLNAMNPDGFQVIVDTAGGVASEWQGYLAFGDKVVQSGVRTDRPIARPPLAGAGALPVPGKRPGGPVGRPGPASVGLGVFNPFQEEGAAPLTVEPALLAASVTVSLSAAAALTTEIQMAGASSIALTTTGSLSTEIRMAGAVSVAFAGTGALTTEIQLVAAASIVFSGTADLTAVTAQAGSGIAPAIGRRRPPAVGRFPGAPGLSAFLKGAHQRLGESGIAVGAELAASVSISVSATAALTTEIQLAGAASVVFTTAADFTSFANDAQSGYSAARRSPPIAIPGPGRPGLVVFNRGAYWRLQSSEIQAETLIAGAATLAFTATAVLTTEVRMAGAATVSLATAGTLTTQVTMVGAATITLTTAGALTTGLEISGAALISVTVAGVLTTAINLAGVGTVVFAATADLLTVPIPQLGRPPLTAPLVHIVLGADVRGSHEATMTGSHGATLI